MQEPHYTGIRVETREHNHLAWPLVSGPSGPCPIANTVCYYRSIVWDGPGVTSDQCIPRGHPVVTGPSLSHHNMPEPAPEINIRIISEQNISEPSADYTEMFSFE